MGTYENFYLNRIKQLQEENKQLREVLNEARIRNEPLPERLGDERRDSRTVSSVSRSSSNISRNVDRDVEKMSILAALVDPNHEINKKENADEKASIIRVLGDMGMLKVEKKYEPGMSSRDYFFPSGKPAAEGGPGTGTANREDMERYIKATRYKDKGGFGHVSIIDKPNS